MQSPLTFLRRGFTLLELLLVVLIMGIAYGLLLNTSLSHTFKPQKKTDFEMDNPLTYFKKLPGYGHARFELYVQEKGDPILLRDGEAVTFTGHLPKARPYTLMPDESLDPADPQPVRIEGKEYRPLYRLVCNREGLMEPLILETEEGWLYIHPFRPTARFVNSADLIAHIHAESYLPDKAGYAR
ncbi:MAG: prepilin-type N-terminal cleavage/methylation domain-containing protein [Epsilonproteobacteria bacterium]|nr:prepilin-type N-terminal cleavage/methylation domain-containing protein [Campylobacterota bacterium]